jgi:hypothetical protein
MIAIVIRLLAGVTPDVVIKMEVCYFEVSGHCCHVFVAGKESLRIPVQHD